MTWQRDGGNSQYGSGGCLRQNLGVLMGNRDDHSRIVKAQRTVFVMSLSLWSFRVVSVADIWGFTVICVQCLCSLTRKIPCGTSCPIFGQQLLRSTGFNLTTGFLGGINLYRVLQPQHCVLLTRAHWGPSVILSLFTFIQKALGECTGGKSTQQSKSTAVYFFLNLFLPFILVRVIITLMKCNNQKELWRKGCIWLSLLYYCSLWKEVRTETQAGMQPAERSWIRDDGVVHLTASHHMASSDYFLL